MKKGIFDFLKSQLNRIWKAAFFIVSMLQIMIIVLREIQYDNSDMAVWINDSKAIAHMLRPCLEELVWAYLIA